LFFASALGALAGLLAPDGALFFGTLFAVVGAIATLVLRSLAGRAVSLVLAAFSLAALAGGWQATISARRSEQLPSAPVVLEGIVDDVSFTKKGGRRLVLAVEGSLAGDEAAPLDATIAVFVPPSVRDPIDPGDRLRARGRAHPLEPALQPGEFDEQKLGLARGVDGSLAAAHGNVAVVERHASFAPFARMRLWLHDRLADLLPPRMAGLELALLVGDTSLLDDEQREIYRRAGAGHLLAVSGLQVSLLALIARRVALAVILATPAGRKGRGRTAASMIALAAVWGFVALCGVPPSAVRAGAMATAILCAPLVHRRARSLDALGIAGLGTVLVSPASVLDPSFLLSYAAVLGLAATASVRHRVLKGVVASVGAGLVTLPISAYLFGQLAPAGLLDNIILVPAATFLQVPALALGLLGALVDSSFIAWLGGEAALVLEALTKGLGDLLPGVRAIDAPSGALTLLLITAALAFAAAVARRRVAIATAVAVAAVAAVAVERREPAGVRITVLPVGQGDSAVFEFPDGAAMVIDGGGTWDGRADPGTDVVIPFLQRRGIDRIALMVLSHQHPDHALGLVSVAHAVPVDVLWQNGADATLNALLASSTTAKLETTPAILGVHPFHQATIEVLAPAPAEHTATYPELEANDNSLVLRICYAGDCALWPGDAEALGEDLLLHTGHELHASVVKAPHHGSATSSTDAFISTTGASDVVFCTGRGNSFGFPAQAVIDRWRAAGARLWDTSRNGEVRIWLTGHGAIVRGFVEAQVQAGTR
jgi:competence protein ComEC